MTELGSWLALLRAPGIGPARFAKLLEQFGSPEAVLAAPRQALSPLGLPEATVAALSAPDWARVEQDLAWLEHPSNHLLHCQDSRYPFLLRQIHNPPPLLFVHGNLDCLSDPQLAIVGSRNPTSAGRRTARDFAAHLSHSGLIITSGLALGIDAEAHRGALEGSGQTIAVMGTGLDRIYPAKHRELAHAIAERGALLSELPPGSPPIAENFPPSQSYYQRLITGGLGGGSGRAKRLSDHRPTSGGTRSGSLRHSWLHS